MIVFKRSCADEPPSIWLALGAGDAAHDWGNVPATLTEGRRGDICIVKLRSFSSSSYSSSSPSLPSSSSLNPTVFALPSISPFLNQDFSFFWPSCPARTHLLSTSGVPNPSTCIVFFCFCLGTGVVGSLYGSGRSGVGVRLAAILADDTGVGPLFDPLVREMDDPGRDADEGGRDADATGTGAGL